MCSPMLIGYAHATTGMLNGLDDAKMGYQVSTMRLYASLRSKWVSVVTTPSFSSQEFISVRPMSVPSIDW